MTSEAPSGRASGTPMDLIGKTVRWASRVPGSDAWFTARVLGEHDEEFDGWDATVLESGTPLAQVGDVVFVARDWITVIDSEPDTDDPECE